MTVAAVHRLHEAVHTAALSPDGRTVLTGGVDGTARLWDADTGRLRGLLRHPAPVVAVAFSPDSRLVLTGCWDGTAQVWEATNGRPQGPPLRHRGPVRAVAFGPDGRTAATAAQFPQRPPRPGEPADLAGEVCVWDLPAGQLLIAPLRHPAVVRAVAFHPAGHLLLTGCEDGSARFFVTGTGSAVDQPLLHEGAVCRVAFSPDGRAALTGAAGGDGHAAVRLWEVSPGPVLRRPLRHADDVIGLAFSPDGRSLLTACRDHTARLWDAETGRPLTPPLRHDSDLWGFAFEPGGALLTSDNRGIVRYWDRSTGRLVRERRLPKGGGPFAFSPDCRLALGKDWGAPGHPIQAWELATWKPAWPPVKDCRTAAFAGDTLLTGAADGRVEVIAGATGRALRGWRVPGRPNVVALSGDGRTAAAGAHRLVWLWDAASGRPKGPPLAHQSERIHALAFSPDGLTLLSGGDDRTARLWDVATGKQLGPPLPHSRGVRAVAFAPDGRRLATGCDDDRARVGELPPPVGGEAERVRLWVEVLTGLELDAGGAVRELGPDELRRRQERLDGLGGTPPGAARVLP
jgi:WD40 repeat protein